MGNISTNLLRFNGEIGPQYLDPDDKTGGPDGTMKPITKDVLREMIMLNLPEIQKVQDEYVKAELESIKQTQQQILQRLNQPINTQLTGSIVGTEKIAENVTVTPGSNAIITQTYDISSYRRIGIDAYESSFTAHPWRLRAGNKNTGPFGIIEDDRHDREATQNSIMNRLSITSFDVTRPILRVEILNNDSVERSYDVIVIKMR